jgi:hypothetical protein
MSYLDDSSYKLGILPQDLISLRDMRIAAPDQVVYRSAATSYVRADFSRVSDGFTSVEWVWDMISISRLSTLLGFLNGADYINLYVQTDKRDGTFPNPRASFAVFYAMMWKPILSGEEGVSVVKSPYTMQTVKIQFVNMIEQAGYYLL